MTEETPVWFDGELRERIQDELDYGDSFAAYVRDSVRLRQALENSEEREILEGIDGLEGVDFGDSNDQAEA